MDSNELMKNYDVNDIQDLKLVFGRNDLANKGNQTIASRGNQTESWTLGFACTGDVIRTVHDTGDDQLQLTNPTVSAIEGGGVPDSSGIKPVVEDWWMANFKDAEVTRVSILIRNG